MVETLQIIFVEGTRPGSTTWKHLRSQDSRYTYRAFASKNIKEALRQPPVRGTPPRRYLRRRRRNEIILSSSSFASSPVTTQTNQCDRLQEVINEALFPKLRRLTWSIVDAWCKPTLHSVDFEPPLWRGQKCKLFIDAKSSFVSPRGEASFQYSFRYFCLVYANFFLTAHLTTAVCFACPCILCCIWRLFSVELCPS